MIGIFGNPFADINKSTFSMHLVSIGIVGEVIGQTQVLYLNSRNSALSVLAAVEMLKFKITLSIQ